MKKFIDTHAHYGHKKFKDKHILDKIHDELKYIIQVGTDVKTNEQAIKLAEKYDNVYAIIGFFPTTVHEIDKRFQKFGAYNYMMFKKQLEHPKVIGIGEIGLDYKWNCVDDMFGYKAREIQKEWFIYQLNLAKKLNLPVSIHSRDAEKDTLDIINNFDEIKGVVHCYAYGVEAMKKLIEKGLYIGIGGTSTYKKNEEIRDVIKECPIDRILLETDAPYLSPEPVRRHVNDSTNIKYVIENIAKIKGITEEEIIKITNENAERLFKF